MPSVISIENVSKSYRLGVISSGTLREDLQSWWHRVRGLPDPNRRVDQVHAAVEGHTLWALQNISLEIEQGEVLGIIGRNGAGKSTLLKILSRVTAPTAGCIRVKGRVASLLEVGTGFHPELTGRENVFLNGAILGMTKSEVARKFDEIVAFAELENFIDTPVKRYSSGMYVRLAFAVAAHLEPEILVVDEVLAVGDAAFQKKCLGKMNAVAGEGRTVLFVSHYMPTIMGLCSKAILIEAGRMIRAGAPAEVIAAYQSSFQVVGTDRTSLEKMARRGSGLVRVTHVNTGSDVPGQGLHTGSPGSIRLGYEARQVPVNIYAIIYILNARGEHCLHLNSDKVNQMLTLEREAGEIVCRMPRCQLVPGEYIMNIKLCDMGGGTIDHLQQGVVLHVGEGDFYGTGRPPVPGTGNILVDYSFSVDS